MSLPDRPARKPSWLTVKGFGGQEFNRVNALVNSLGLKTVCHEANCPNRGECFGRGTAVFLILGPNCTRNCGFCNVTTGRPNVVDDDEPKRVAQASGELGLRHVVVTSVTRDDLPDGGARHFARTIEEIRSVLPTATIEVLVPDFRGNSESLDTVLAARPDVFNHNVETVPRLYPVVRPQADYQQSLQVLSLAARRSSARIKSGLMVGLGETMDELCKTFEDLANSHVSLLTIGQYLSPSRMHIPVERYVSPDEFLVLQREAEKAGIGAVFSGPLVRSSYLADAFLRQS
ncbi:MAG: lipoyl synthase [Candidatus Zixiibacteriota bacterium]